ncbi:unnamed protein product [Sphenostylis stenocarpa]|uniref:Uncharacterized protein n=1 Tax=Sphenostylis stenocarpa TaxID=92480 RepID=A0AA86S1X1_9FABA|nr:unnamed protein product [Sphenostylis stenocarpa]
MAMIFSQGLCSCDILENEGNFIFSFGRLSLRRPMKKGASDAVSHDFFGGSFFPFISDIFPWLMLMFS